MVKTVGTKCVYGSNFVFLLINVGTDASQNKKIYIYLVPTNYKLVMKKYLYVFMVTMLPFAAQSQKIECFQELMPDMYEFNIYEPKGYNPVSSTNMPLVMYLHGRSMSIGLNGYPYGPQVSIERGYDILKGQPALIVEPKAMAGEGWSSAKLHKIYEFMVAHYAFDHSRFYVIGMSMGGWGTLNYANKVSG